jgi:uncharacterized protein
MSDARPISIWAALGAWFAIVLAAAVYGMWHGYAGHSFGITLSILSFFLAMQLLLAAGHWGERLARRAGSHFSVLLGLIPFLAYLIYLAGTNSFTWWRVMTAAAYTLVPVLLGISAVGSRPGVWQDYLAMLIIFLPLKLRWLNQFWPYPATGFAYVATMLLAMNVALVTFLFVRQLDGIGYNIIWGRKPALAVIINFSLLAVTVIPLGMALHFVRFDPALARWKALPTDAAAIFLLTAWPEELLFRGLLQNCLSRTFSSENAGWISASVIFGLAHITNNGVFPNWRYALLATIAGIFYGRTWRKAGSIFPATIVHALVDTTWHFLFRTL